MFPFRRSRAVRAAQSQARAEDLAAEGRLVEAIAAGEAANQNAPSPALQRQVANWRYQASKALASSRPRADWPPNVPDPFPRNDYAIPEIAASALTAKMLGGGIVHHGSLLMRGFLPRATAKRMRQGIDQAFEHRANAREHDPNQAWFAPLDAPGHPGFADARGFGRGASMLMADSPRMISEWVRVLRGTGVHEVVADHLGETPVLSAMKTTLYRVPHDGGSQWHQDGAFLGADVRTVNLWVALSDCGEDAPGLDIVPCRLTSVVETGTHGSLFDWSVGEGKIPEVTGGRPAASPVFRAGDAMLFDHLCLHRTGIRAGMTKTRYAIETWMFAPSTYPDAPLVI